MSIIRAVERAYKVTKERGWDTVYWAVDLHGTVLESNYEAGGYQFISQDVVDALRHISNLPETRIILWSSVHEHEWPAVAAFIREASICVDFCNHNPEVANSTHGCFDQKFYFSILVDDKAGFCPSEWADVAAAVTQARLGMFNEAEV